jgi:hypothetical protein
VVPDHICFKEELLCLSMYMTLPTEGGHRVCDELLTTGRRMQLSMDLVSTITWWKPRTVANKLWINQCDQSLQACISLESSCVILHSRVAMASLQFKEGHDPFAQVARRAAKARSAPLLAT